MKVLMLMLTSCILLFGHKLNVFANEENGTIYVKSYFTKSSPCMQCDAKISQNNKIIHTAKTDDVGQISFKIGDKSSNIDIEISAGAGHLGKCSFEFEQNTTKNQKHINEEIEENNQIIKIIFAIIAIFGLFWFLKRIKQK